MKNTLKTTLTVAQLLFLTTALLASFRVAADTCEGIFSGSSSYTRLVRIYSNEAKGVKIDPSSLSLFDSPQLVDPMKIRLIKRHSQTLESLLRQGKITAKDLVQTKVFIAEALVNGTYVPQYFFAKFSGRAFLFSLSDATYFELGIQRVGHLRGDLPSFFRIDKGLILATPADGRNVSVFSGELKDPLLIENAIALVTDPVKKEFLTQFKDELTEILISTEATIPEFIQSDLKIGVISGTDVQVGYFVASNIQFYLTKQAKLIDPVNTKNWGQLKISRPIGFAPKARVTIEFPDGKKYTIEDGVIKIPTSYEEAKFLLEVKSEDSELLSLFHKRFRIKYHEEIADLISKGYLDQFDVKGLEIMVPSINSKIPELLLLTKKGYVVFKREGGWIALENLDAKIYGTSFYISNGLKLAVKIAPGFMAERTAVSEITDNTDRNFDAFLVKVKVATGREHITAEEMTLIQNMSTAINTTFGMAKQSGQKITENVLSQLATAITGQQKAFSVEEITEIIKLTIIQYEAIGN